MRRHIIVPLLLFIVASSALTLLWWTQEKGERSRLDAETKVTAEQIRRRIEAWVDDRVRAVDLIIHDLESTSDQFEDRFRDHAESLLEIFPGYQAINWVDSDWVIRIVVPEEPNRSALNRDLHDHPGDGVTEAIERAEQTGKVTRTPAITLLQGGLGFAFYRLVQDEAGRRLGFINGVFRTQELFDLCLAEPDLRRRFAFELRRVEGDLIYSSGLKPEKSTDSFRHSVLVRIVDLPWELKVSPSAAYMREFKNSGDEAFLIAGLGLTLLISWLLSVYIRGRAEFAKGQARYRAIVEDQTELIIRFGTDGTLTFVNGATCRYFGEDAEKLIGQNAIDWVLSEDRPSVSSFIASLDRDRAIGSIEHRVMDPSGQIRWQSWNYRAIFDDQGELIEIQGSGRDTTEHHEAEEKLRASESRLRTFITSTPDLIMTQKADGTYGELVGITEDMLVDPGRPLPGRHPRDMGLPKDLVDDSLKLISAALQTGEIQTLEYQLEVRAGLKDFESRYVPVAEDEVIVFIRDITEHKELERQLLQAQKMEAVGQLTGGIAHDFNNLLTAINGYADLALEDIDRDSPVRVPLEMIQKAGTRAAALTSQLLAFGRRQMLRPKVLDLNTRIEGMIEILRRSIGEDIEIATEFDSELGPIKADPTQIEQIIMNLAVNARDAMPEGGRITIRTQGVVLDSEFVRLFPDAKIGPHALITFTDTGSGMDAETCEHVFEPFFTTKEVGKGTGLGLSMVYGFVSQSGGAIELESEPGKGTTFKIYFPITRHPADEAPANEEPDATQAGDETILLVEDEDAVRRLAKSALSKLGYTVHSASDPAEALELFAEHGDQIDLVISDVVMPGMRGPELIARLTQTRPNLKVLYISGYTDSSGINTERLSEGARFLRKPFRIKELARVVREILGN